MKSWEIEKMLKEDIREKKKTGSGAFHMRGKGVKHGFSGALRTPFHFMKTKEKKKLDGEVMVHNMFTTILDWKEFQLKDRETQKMLLTKWRETFTNTQIQEQLQVGRDKAFNTQSFADLVNDLGCPPKLRGGSKAKEDSEPKRKYTRKAKTVAIGPNQVELVMPSTQLQFTPEPEPEQPKVTIFNGLNLEYNGEYTAEELTKIFTKLQLLVDGEENKYKISLALVEMG